MKLGQIVATKGALSELSQYDILEALKRYINYDWGDVCEEDWAQNDWAVKNGERVLASYKSSKGVEFWIITEWDRSYTTILLPEEY